MTLTSVEVSRAISTVPSLRCEDHWRESQEKTPCVITACMPLHLAQPRLGRPLSQPVSMAHPRAALPRRKSRESRYVCSPEPNSHSNVTSDTIAIGYQPRARVFALPGSARLNRTHRINITMPVVSGRKHGSRESAVGRAKCTGAATARCPARTGRQRRRCCRPQGSSLASAEHGEYRIRRGHKPADIKLVTRR